MEPGVDLPPVTFHKGELVGGCYEIREELGAGAMGQVFEAHDIALNRRVAIKCGWPGAAMGPKAVWKEAEALSAIRHGSVVTVHAAGLHRDMPYVVMERLYGVTLEAFLEKRRKVGEPMMEEEAVAIVCAVAEGLSAVHSAGLVHRDLKPANIMLAPNNRVVLLDFGIFLPEFQVGHSSLIAGSPAYMAPEAIMGRVERGQGPLVDLYALGVVAWETIVGALPFDADTMQQQWRSHLAAPVPELSKVRPDVSPRLGRVIGQLMAKDPRDRPQSAETVVWELGNKTPRWSRRPPPSPARPFNVLIVDDDPHIAKILSFHAKKAIPDATFEFATDGDGALAMVAKRAPDVILLDLHMPKMNGVEVCMYIRGMPGLEHCPIVSVSAGAQEKDVHLLRQLQIVDHVEKGAGLGERLVSILGSLPRPK